MDAMKRRVPASSLIGICFGCLWAFAGSIAFSGAIRGALLIATVIVASGVVVHVSRKLAAGESQSNIFHRRPYVVAVVLEAVAIAGIVALLPRYRAEQYLLEVIGIIVGLHFIGLWKASLSPRFLWISAGMCLVSTASILVQHATAHARTGAVLTGFGNALILWSGAGLVDGAVPRPDQER